MNYVKLSQLAILSTLSLSLAGCDWLWPRDNPLDPGRCDPRCGTGEVCIMGTCVTGGLDFALGDSVLPKDGPAVERTGDLGDLGDLGVKDAGDLGDLGDQGTADKAKSDGQPDAGQVTPSCLRGWVPAGNASITSPTTMSLYDIWGSSTSDLYAVGGTGTILHYSGKSWSDISSNAGSKTNILRAVWGSSKTDVFVVGSGGLILHYNGLTWKDQSSTALTTQDLLAVFGLSSKQVWAVGKNGALLSFNGSTWSSSASSPSSSADYLGIWGSDTSNLYVIGSLSGAPRIWRWSGVSWSDITPLVGVSSTRTLTSIWGADAKNILITAVDTKNQNTYMYYSAGTSWSSHASTKVLRAIRGSGTDMAFSVGDSGAGVVYNGTFLRDLSSGSGTSSGLNGVWVIGDEAWAVGSMGAIRRWIRPWKVLTSGTTNNLRGVWAASKTEVWAVGDKGTVVYYDGSTPSAGTLGDVNGHFYGLWGANAKEVHTVGPTYYAGVLCRSYRWNGSAWTSTSITCSTGPSWPYGPLALWGTSGTNVFAIGGGNSNPFAKRYDGSTWTDISSGLSGMGPPVDAYGVWGRSSTDVYLVGKAGAIYRYDGTSWKNTTSGVTTTMHGIWGTGTTDLFAVGDSAKVLRHTGTLWASQTLPSTTVEASLYSVWGSSSTNVLVAGANGTILRFNGTTWTDESPGVSLDLLSVHGASAKDIYAVGTKGGFLHYCEP